MLDRCVVLGRLRVVAGAVGRGAEVRRTIGARLPQRATHAVGIEVCRVNGCARLLAPGLLQASTIDGVKAQLFEQLHDRRLRRLIACDRKRNPIIRSIRPTVIAQVLGVDVVERLYDRTLDLLRDPHALGGFRFKLVDSPIALPGVVVPGVDHHDVVAHPGEQVARQLRNRASRES